MNKSDLIEKLAQNCELSPIQSEEIVNIILDQMKTALIAKRRIEIRGFGSFRAKLRKSRMMRNPKTRTTIWKDSRWLVAFKVGKELSERINGDELSA